MELNLEQQQAVEAGDGPVLIVAGPGTGKTKTLTARVAYLLTEKLASPAEIVALTFTNKAAQEMRERLASQLVAAKLPTVTTFHALCLALLQRRGDDRTLLTEAQRISIINELGRPPIFKNASSRELGFRLSQAKASLESPEDAALRTLLDSYQHTLAERNMQDFDDLLKRTYALLQADITKQLSYRYVLVDEFQDTSDLQYELLRLLAPQNNIFAIGDPNQSIYAFRGVSSDMFGRFKRDFPNAQLVNLVRNYRSARRVVDLANAIFPEAPALQTVTQDVGSADVVETLNEFSEAAYVIDAIERGIGGSDLRRAHGDQEMGQPRDYAVLYRTHRAALVLQRAFADAGLPYQIVGEGSPYDNPDVQAVLAALHYLHDLCLPLGDQLVYDLASSIAHRLNYAVTDGLQQFLNSLVQFGSCRGGLKACLQHFDEISETAFYDPTINAVTLLTIHAAKGLEFEHVFVIACEDGVLPKRETDTNEERRLFYVAATRAKTDLVLLYVQNRKGKPTRLSQFIQELSPKLLPRTQDPRLPHLERKARKQAAKRAQGSLF